MDCKRTQQLLHDLADDRLSDRLAHELRQHLTECTDCRVAEQRTARLLRLVALKRHEQPLSGYLDAFVANFHARLDAEDAARRHRWERVLGWIPRPLVLQPERAWRFGWAGAVGVALALGMLWTEIQQNVATAPATTVQTSVPTESLPLLAEVSPLASVSVPITVAATVPPRPAASSPAIGVLIVPAMRVEPEKPRYVLDRIVVTPVSYEVASAHF
jgi:anti-sigma factor RsiW